MSFTKAIAISGPFIFATVFLVKAGYFVGLWTKGNKQDADLQSLESSLEALRQTVSNGFDRIYSQISKLSTHITEIRENYVAKDECSEIHKRLEERAEDHEQRISELERFREKHDS